jgi:hypothetical protein
MRMIDLLFFFYLELLKKFTAIPQNVLDLFNPQESEILGKSQRHIPYLQAGQRGTSRAVTGFTLHVVRLLELDLLVRPHAR